MILDNDTTAMTGHQNHPATGVTVQDQPTARLDIAAMVKAIGIKNIREVDPLNLTQLETVLKEELAREEPSVIITRRPCALLKNVHFDDEYIIDPELCTGCKAVFASVVPAFISWTPPKS